MDTGKKNVFIIDTNNPESIKGLQMAMVEAMKDMKEETEETEEHISQKEAIAFLGISEPTFIKLRNAEQIPFKQVGRQYHYYKSQLKKVNTKTINN